MNKVVILGIDNFSYKNTYQVKCLNQNNYKVYVFTNDVLNTSSKNLSNKNDLKILEKGLGVEQVESIEMVRTCCG